MNGMSRIPAENLALAREVLELAKHPDGGVIAASDQIRAYAAEQAPRLEAIARAEPGATYQYVDVTPIALAWEYAVIAAMRSRTRYSCIHFAEGAPGLGTIAWIDMTLGLMTCEPCFAPATIALARRYGGQVPDDGHCDVCDREERTFVAFNAQVSMWLVSGNQCASCTRAMTGEAE
jgi:hypothetical protein